jgi:hypothetical protein
VGYPLALEGAIFTVRELGTATCVGGEGQLPFTIQPGESYTYADLASSEGTRFATLEYDSASGEAHAFSGQVLSHAELRLDGEAPPSTAGGREGKGIKCPNCDAPISQPAGREVKTLVCEYCGAQNDLTGAEAVVMGVNPKRDPHFLFEIGQRGRFLGQSYEVCGRLLYEDEEGYQTREYLLFNPGEGYLWLAEEQGHFVLNRPTQQAPATNVFGLPTKHPVDVGGTRFRFYESGQLRLVYVDGALPWQARSGDCFVYADLTAPPRMLSAEIDGQEVEFFSGHYLTPAEVWEAFALTDSPPRPDGVHAAQPFRRGPVARMLMLLGGLFALVNLGLLAWSAGRNGRIILEQTFQGPDYQGEVLSEPFAIGPEKVMGLTIRAPLSNSWLGVEAALVDSQDQVVEEMDGDISYYYGYEGGESWSEGTQQETFYFRAPSPGSYKLVLRASGGSGLSGPCRNEPLTVRLTQGAVLSRYFLFTFLLALCFPLYEILRKRLFENRRWAPVTEDSSDDDE